MKWQAVVLYHCDLMSEYRAIWWDNFETEEEAKEGLNKWFKEHPFNDEDPDNPESDLYDSLIQKID